MSRKERYRRVERAKGTREAGKLRIAVGLDPPIFMILAERAHCKGISFSALAARILTAAVENGG